jgi:hypothetical protein
MDQAPHGDQISATLVAKMTGGQRLTEDEKSHLAECEQCMKAIVEALERKRKTEGPGPDTDRSRPAVQGALERARQVFQREFGISLSPEPSPAPEAKAS